MISLSPTVRSGVVGVTPTPLLAQFVGTAFGSQNFWFSSKSMFVVPDGFWTRDQNSCEELAGRRRPPGTGRTSFRSLLFGGIEPLTIVGVRVVLRRALAERVVDLPFGLSLLRDDARPQRGAAPAREPVDAGLAPLTTRFALVSISKLLPARTLLAQGFAAPATTAPDSKNTDAAPQAPQPWRRAAAPA